MHKEINKAVDTFHRIAFGTKNNVDKIPQTKLAAFISALTELLTARYEKNWYPENPNRGSGYRCIRVNGQSIDPTVLESLKRAQIKYSKDLIITELTIWVDPGVVSVRIGEDGSIGSEVVDEKVFNIGKESSAARETEEGFSSRSSSPGTSSGYRSSSSQSSSQSSSPVPSQYSATEFNPYCPSYASHYQRPTSPTYVQTPERNPSPTASQVLPNAVRSQRRPVIPFGSTMIPTPSRDIFNQSSYIPVSATQHMAAFSRSSALFSNQNTVASAPSFDGIGKVAFSPYHAMSMMYGGNLQQSNFYDIPAMA
jgi:hypothetical protein